ncbi:MAG: hypothetical protein AAB733_03770 [Patescibacteria group bacterium]
MGEKSIHPQDSLENFGKKPDETREAKETIAATIHVTFRVESDELKGTIAQDDSSKPRRKIVFVDGYRSERASAYRGTLPKDAETWVCDVVRDTRPENVHKGALMVRPTQKLEGESSVPTGDLEAWIQKKGTSHPESWVPTLGTYLSKEGLSGAKVLIGGNRLYAVKGERAMEGRPTYFESSMGGSSPYKWVFWEIHDVVDGTPKEVLRIVGPRVAKEAEEKRLRDEAKTARIEIGHRTRPELDPKLNLLSDRLRAIGLPEITFGEEGFSHPILVFREYTDSNFQKAEADVAAAEKKYAELMIFEKGVAELIPRIEALGLKHQTNKSYNEFSVHEVGPPQARGSRYRDTTPRYSGRFSRNAEDLEKLRVIVEQKELAAAEAKAKADAEAEAKAEQARREAEAAAAGLPSDVRLMPQLQGQRDANIWVIRPDGTLREKDSDRPWSWRQVLPGELVLQWAKDTTASPHRFEKFYEPPKLTPEQLDAVAAIQADLAAKYDGQAGMSGRVSPPVGKGWDFAPPAAPAAATESSITGAISQEDMAAKLAALQERFKKKK